MASYIELFLKRMTKVALTAATRNSWNKKILSLQYDFPGELEKNSLGITLKLLSINISYDEFEFILDSYSLLKQISRHLSPKFYISENQFFIEFDNKKLNPTTAEEILIITEIYVAGTYNFSVPHPVVVFDVGMNVGFASLFFASNSKVSKVYSFEPFEMTYNQAKRNFFVNPSLEEKVECFNYGLGDKEEALVVNYNYENKGQVGIYGTSLIRSRVLKEDKVTITLREASVELTTLIKKHPTDFFAIKIDCEGAEYAILKNLWENDMLRFFKILFIEWHEKGPDELVNLLSESGFSVFYQQSANKKVGMIYASR